MDLSKIYNYRNFSLKCDLDRIKFYLTQYRCNRKVILNFSPVRYTNDIMQYYSYPNRHPTGLLYIFRGNGQRGHP